MTGTTQAVASGVAYPVTAVVDVAPESLDQFVGTAAFTITLGATAYRVWGEGDRTGDHVRFHEKDDVGKDVRVWHVTQTEHGFAAEHVAVF
jgi:hypothetical protein